MPRRRSPDLRGTSREISERVSGQTQTLDASLFVLIIAVWSVGPRVDQRSLASNFWARNSGIVVVSRVDAQCSEPSQNKAPTLWSNGQTLRLEVR